jgi:uncharacterized protein (TIGR03000 family)
MYSVVVMMALTSGAETPDRHRGGCGGHEASCGGRHHGLRGRHHGDGCGAGGCGVVYSGCSSCGVAHSGCSTCGVGYGGCGTPVYGAPTFGAPVYPGTPAPVGEPIKKMPSGDKKTGLDPAEATIVVTLPEDARLSVDGTDTTSTSGVRLLVSPTLEPGRDFHYTLRAEVTRDGKPVRVEKTIAVRAGEETQVTLDLPATSVAQR